MEGTVYLDNSATTQPCRRAVEAVVHSLESVWGNPSSLHRLGMEAELSVGAAREAAARMLHARPDEIVFTSGGTEANNAALLGAAAHGKKRGKRIVTTEIEHPSVLETAKRLQAFGFEVVFLSPGRNGVVPLASLREAITPDTVLVSMMLVNNETGAIQPVAETAALIRESGAPALLHCDAVQAFGKLPINTKELGADLISVSGHKIHGPKGVGFLYIRRGVHLSPLLTGGGQEQGLRSGTEGLPLICGLQGAIEALPDLCSQLSYQRRLRGYAAERLAATGFVTINFSEDCLPYILNISVPGYRSETLLHFLEQQNIFVSSGSACAKGRGSYVLTACGLSRAEVESALRISFSRDNTETDIDRLTAALSEAVKKLRKAYPT